MVVVTPGVIFQMNHRPGTILHGLFAPQVISNIVPRAALSTLEMLGTKVTHGGHGEVVIELKGYTEGFHDSRQALPIEEVSALRNFLGAASIDPARDLPMEATTA
jgi:hypothetical protein